MNRTRTILVGSLSLVALLAVGLATLSVAGGASSGATRVEAVAIDGAGADPVQVELAPDVAQLRVRALPEGRDALLDGTVALLARERLEADLDPAGDGRVALRARSRPGLNLHVRGPVWDLGLSRTAPTRLQVRASVGDVDLDLRGSRVERLDSLADVGRQTVHLADRDLSGRLATDVGRVELIVPHDADARVDVATGLRRVDADPAFYRSGGAWHLDGGGARIDLTVRAGMGEVVLRRGAPDPR
jgi:hypothetical protein